MPRTFMWVGGAFLSIALLVAGAVAFWPKSDKVVTVDDKRVPLPEKKPKKLEDCPVQPCSDVVEKKEEAEPKVVVTPPSTGAKKPPLQSEPSFDEQIRRWNEEAR